MTGLTRHIERSGPAVRAALEEFSPQECVLFEQQFQQALVDAGQQYDLGPMEAVLSTGGEVRHGHALLRVAHAPTGRAVPVTSERTC